MLDDRARLLLKTLVERYIADGQPVGSRTLSRVPGLELSPATIRNVMSDLEEHGLIASPHTSAGRVPTARGYRLFVDTMLTAKRDEIAAPTLAADQPQKVIANAANMLSNLSQFVGVVMAPRRTSTFRHIEFLRLSEKRLLVIIVSPEGDVQNRVIFPEIDFSQSELVEASNYINMHYSGLSLEQVRDRLQSEVEKLRGEIAALMQAAVNVSSEVLTEAQEDDVVISGERNLLSVTDFSSDMGQLRRAFELFEQKAQLMRLLDVSSKAEGVRIFIGGESQVVPIEELSIVSANYEVDGQVVGTLGVIGPTRMPYERMIQIVDITSRLVSNALSQAEDEVVIAGERNLLSVSDFSSDMTHLRRAFDLFEQKAQLMRLLDVSSKGEGVRIFIGGESQVVPYEELSVVTTNYEVDGQVVGTLGVIGPTRMPYERMIQIVDITSRLVSNALSHRK